MQISVEEKRVAHEYLERTREQVVQAVAGLTAGQWEFRAGEREWSVLDVVEHLAVIEQGVQKVIARLPQAPEDDAGRDVAAMDNLILTRMPRRGRRFEAPEFVAPSGRWSAEEAVRQFLATREATIGLLETAASLRGRVLPHPAFGPWDGYQWILGTAAHTERHVGQIGEIKLAADDRR